ncbi:hypothetical protein TNCV_4895201 [Trichonephila clavipes]|nr:hypothetical protein TNCV_4895201 [Trichonephila clavipes]
MEQSNKRLKSREVPRNNILLVPNHHPLLTLEQEVAKGKEVFIQVLWTLHAKSKLYRLAYKAWKRHGPQNLTTWTLLVQAVLDGCYGEKCPSTVFQVPDTCPSV